MVFCVLLNTPIAMRGDVEEAVVGEQISEAYDQGCAIMLLLLLMLMWPANTSTSTMATCADLGASSLYKLT